MPASTAPVWSFGSPSEVAVRAFLDSQRGQPVSYREVGATAGHPPKGYTYDDHQVKLGEGEARFAKACAGLREWRMFPAPWMKITPDEPSEIREGLVVAVQARGPGLWWVNACRVVYLVDETGPVRRRGFAYGTLPAHVEQGEELFTIEQWVDGSVWYRVQAFSRPRHWTVRATFPLVRVLQRKFVRDSCAAMRQFVQTPS